MSKPMTKAELRLACYTTGIKPTGYTVHVATPEIAGRLYANDYRTASDEARHARARGYLADVTKRIESLADEIEREIVNNGDFAGYHDPMKACVANLRSAADQLDELP